MPDQETSINPNIANVFDQLAKSMLHFRYEYSTPELMLKVLLQDDRFRKCFDQMYVPDEYVDDLNNQLDEYLKELTTIPADVKLSDRLETSAQLDNLMVNAIIEAKARGEETFTISDMVYIRTTKWCRELLRQGGQAFITRPSACRIFRKCRLVLTPSIIMVCTVTFMRSAIWNN